MSRKKAAAAEAQAPAERATSIFGEMIRDARTRRHLTQAELASRCTPPVNPVAVTQWERADHPLSERTLLVVAAALNITLEELLTECLRARGIRVEPTEG